MKNTLTARAFRSSALLLLVFAGASASASPVLILQNYRIATALGVEYAGSFYDVDFLDGNCAAVFGSCDGNTAFTFDTALKAEDASSVLLRDVFANIGTPGITSYDSFPFLTNGCGSVSIQPASFGSFSVDYPGGPVNTDRCTIVTPYDVTPTPNNLGVILYAGLAINDQAIDYGYGKRIYC